MYLSHLKNLEGSMVGKKREKKQLKKSMKNNSTISVSLTKL